MNNWQPLNSFDRAWSECFCYVNYY